MDHLSQECDIFVRREVIVDDLYKLLMNMFNKPVFINMAIMQNTEIIFYKTELDSIYTYVDVISYLER
jgi:hypothetical protein